MTTKRNVFQYESPLAPMMERLVREKRASGLKYDTPAWVLKDLASISTVRSSPNTPTNRLTNQ